MLASLYGKLTVTFNSRQWKQEAEIPRNGAGVASPVPGFNTVAASTTILSALHNSGINDIFTILNSAWPVSLGGTGGTTAISSWDAITAKGTDIASASTVVLTTATGPRIDITGTTAITAVTLANGSMRIARATGIFVLTASASLIVNKSTTVNYTTAVGDLMIFTAEGGVTSVTVIGSGGLLDTLWVKGANVASATTTVLGAGNYFHITGTTTITDIDFSVPLDGRIAWLEFDGILTLTHNATTLNLPGTANIITAAGDRAMIVQDSGDNIHVITYTRAAAGATNGLVLLTSGTVSAAATLDIVLTGYTAYRGIAIELINMIPATDAVIAWLRVSTDGGATYDAGASNYFQVSYEALSSGSDVSEKSNADTKIVVSENIGNVSSEGVSIHMEIMGQTNAAIKPKIFTRSVGYWNDDRVGATFGGGIRNAAQDTDAIRFLFSSGNIASGTYAVYGYL